jgi:hypothetical protein
MLHHNHWVVKGHGSHQLFEALWAGDAAAYHAIFVDCDAGSLLEAAGARGKNVAADATAFGQYQVERVKARLSDLGILDVDVCARMLSAMVESPSAFPSGVYVATSREGVGPRLRFVEFNQLARLRTVDTEGRDVEWPTSGTSPAL